MAFAFATRARRRASYTALGVLGAAALFGGGALAGNALGGDAAAPPVVPPAGGTVLPGGQGVSTISTLPARGVPATGSDSSSGASVAGSSAVPPSGGICPVAVGDVLSGTSIDPAKVGFAMNLPKAGFSLRSIQLRAEATCGPDGQPQGAGELVLETSWVHDATGLEAYLSQRKTAERISNVRYDGSLLFWSAGYAYSLNVNSYRVYPAMEGAVPPMQGGTTEGSVGGASSASPLAPPTQPDPRAPAVLDELLAQVAADIAAGKCYYTQRPGTWSDILAAGVGDPRPAIPAGFSEDQAYITAFDPPANCDAGPSPDQGSFTVTFSAAAGRGGGIYISGNRLPAGQVPYPGTIDQYSASWSNGSWQFSIGAKADPSPGDAVVRAIARALDPRFDQACLARQVTLSEADLAAMGAGAPATPEGWKRELANAARTEFSGSCNSAQRQLYQGENANFQWVLTGPGGATVSAAGYRQGAEPTAPGYISDGNLSWMAANGWQFVVSGYKQADGTPVPRETLVAIAKGLDPQLDVSKLAEGGPDTPPVKPMPAPAPSR